MQVHDGTPQAFVRDCWYGAVWSDDLAPGAVLARTVLDEPLVFFRRLDGTPTAFYDRCPHRFAPLSWGKVLESGNLQCGYHGLEFGLNGICAHNPSGNQVIPPNAHVQTFPVVERHRMLWVWMGDTQPDAALVPDFSVIDDAADMHIAKLDHMRIEANYRLVIDNLLDPSHIAFLHAGSLGNAEMARAEIDVQSTDRALELDWHAEGVPAPNILRPLFPAHLRDQNVDFWTHEWWSPASNILLQSGACLAGADRSSGTGYYGVHIITPETQRSTLYQFTSVRWNPRTLASEDEAIRTALSVGRREVFVTQDGPIIEAQQRRIDTAAATLPRPALLGIDVAPVRYGRIIDQLLAANPTPAQHLEA